ncbi:hypothetical protein ACFQX4_23530 [Roseomonas sp. GCM10028921]
MTYERLYNPKPCSAWPVLQLRAVGTAYRQAGAEGLMGEASLERAVAAYVAAGGQQAEAVEIVLGMIASLSAEHGDWLWGPAQAWIERHRIEEPDPRDADLFEPEGDAE